MVLSLLLVAFANQQKVAKEMNMCRRCLHIQKKRFRIAAEHVMKKKWK